MTESTTAETESTRDEDEELETEPRDESRDESENETETDAEGPSATAWAVRGAVVGAFAGSVVGAGVGMLVARRPETIGQAGEVVRGNGKQVARAAAAAASGVVTPGRLNQIIAGGGNGDRSHAVRQTAREAGAEAARAARDAIVSLRSEGSGSGS